MNRAKQEQATRRLNELIESAARLLDAEPPPPQPSREMPGDLLIALCDVRRAIAGLRSLLRDDEQLTIAVHVERKPAGQREGPEDRSQGSFGGV